MNIGTLIERECDRCDGEGQIIEADVRCECNQCDGLGLLLTPIGREALIVSRRQHIRWVRRQREAIE